MSKAKRAGIDHGGKSATSSWNWASKDADQTVHAVGGLGFHVYKLLIRTESSSSGRIRSTRLESSSWMSRTP